MLAWWLNDVGDGIVLGTARVVALAALATIGSRVVSTATTPDEVSAPLAVESAVVGILTLPATVSGPTTGEEEEEEATEPVPVLAPREVVADAQRPLQAIRPTTSGGAPTTDEPTEPAEPAASPRGRRCKEEPDPAIRAAANDRWEIERSVVQRYTKHLGRLDELGWSEKHHADDRAPEGIEIGGVRCGSDLWDAGLRAGDVLHSVNGRPVHGYPQALLAYTALHDEDTFVVEVTRKGKKRLLHYQIVG